MIFFYCLFGTMAAVLIGYGTATWWAAKNPQHNVGPSDESFFDVPHRYK